MKALSIHQPWASLIADGFKTIETRTWLTKYRGPLLIVSTAKPRWKQLPLGQALAICSLVDCRESIRGDWKSAFCNTHGFASWVLGAVQKIEPFPMKGQQGLYNVPDALQQQIKVVR